MTANIEQLRALAERLDACAGPMDDQEAVKFASDLSAAVGIDDLGKHAANWRLAISAVGPTLSAIGSAIALMESLFPCLKDLILRRHGSDAEPCWEFTIEDRFVRDHAAPCGARGIDSTFAPTAPLSILRTMVAALISQAESTQ